MVSKEAKLGLEAKRLVVDEPTREVFDRAGIDLSHLVILLKRELRAKKSDRIKIKGAVGELLRGRRIIASSGIDGDTVIEWDEVAWDVRQRARMDAHKLRGDYPAEKHEVGGLNGEPILHKIEVEFVKPNLE